jgi:DNA-binding response OmpR family regulator
LLRVWCPPMPPTILVADDEPTITHALSDLLEDEGYRVLRCFNGQQALDLIDGDAPDLVITDVMMPVVDGVTLTRSLRDRGNATPVVLMSAAYAGVDIPGIRFVPKPFDLDEIVRIVGRVLGTA